jgi:sterol desaturase/sphingolipid hydroxylase (fatty acid hydroxylase superfamily)
MEAFRSLVRYLGMPGLMVAGGWATFALLDAGYEQGLVLLGMSLVIFFVVWGLEILVPYREDWVGSDGQRLNDVGHALFGTFLGGRLGNLVAFGLFGLAAAWVAEHTGGGLWPTSWPMWLQVVLLFLLADLGRYVQHRTMHEVPVLWKYHVLHHSVGAMNVFKTSRNHIVERFFQQPFLFGPAIALGAGPEVILPFVVVNSMLGVFDHSNVDFRLGPLEYVIMGPNAHRIHHSIDMKEGNTNYGTALVVWDILFRTYTSPQSRERAGKGKIDVGVADDPTSPGFFGQLVDPLRSPPPSSS